MTAGRSGGSYPANRSVFSLSKRDGNMTVTSNGLVIAGLELQGVAILLGGISAWSIWRTVRDHYARSRVVREFVGEHRHWYAESFLNFIDADRVIGIDW